MQTEFHIFDQNLTNETEENLPQHRKNLKKNVRIVSSNYDNHHDIQSKGKIAKVNIIVP